MFIGCKFSCVWFASFLIHLRLVLLQLFLALPRASSVVRLDFPDVRFTSVVAVHSLSRGSTDLSLFSGAHRFPPVGFFPCSELRRFAPLRLACDRLPGRSHRRSVV